MVKTEKTRKKIAKKNRKKFNMCKYELMGDRVYVFRRWRGRNELVTVQWEGEGEEEEGSKRQD